MLLAEVGEEASRINDPRLNALMCRLTIYAIADPSSPEYDGERVRAILAEADKLKEIGHARTHARRKNKP